LHVRIRGELVSQQLGVLEEVMSSISRCEEDSLLRMPIDGFWMQYAVKVQIQDRDAATRRNSPGGCARRPHHGRVALESVECEPHRRALGNIGIARWYASLSAV
jgi:hypothetical protein